MNYSANDNLDIMKSAKNYNNFLAEFVKKSICQNNYKQILDFGCADGFFLDSIKKEFEDVDFYGVETDDTSLATCKEKNLVVKNNINDFEQTFDLIYSFNVLEHIENDVDILKCFYNKLNKGGQIIIYVPACQFLFSSMDKKSGHYRRYGKKELINKMKIANFNIEMVEYCDSLGVLATLLYKFKNKITKNDSGNINKSQLVLYDKIFPISRLLDKLFFKCFIGKNLIITATVKQ